MSAVLMSVCQKAEAAVAALPERLQQVFDLAYEKTGVQRAYFMLGFGVLAALYFIFGYFAELLCNVVGLVYPAYASTRAIESADRNDDTRWLTYWVVYACFSILDFFADGILRFFPFYWLFKVVFLVYCFLPSHSNGSTRIYNSLIRPYFLKSSGQIDTAYARMAAKAPSAFEGAFKDSLGGKQQ